MIVDDTITRIFTTIKDEVKAKYKMEYSLEEIQSIIEVQLEATKVGIAKGVTINWHRFCKFVFTNKYKRKEEIHLLQNTLNTMEDLTQAEKDKIVYDKVIESAGKKKEFISDATNIMHKQSTVESLKNKETVNAITIKKFICLTK